MGVAGIQKGGSVCARRVGLRADSLGREMPTAREPVTLCLPSTTIELDFSRSKHPTHTVWRGMPTAQ